MTDQPHFIVNENAEFIEIRNERNVASDDGYRYVLSDDGQFISRCIRDGENKGLVDGEFDRHESFEALQAVIAGFRR